MADRTVADQPTVYTMDQLKDAVAPDDVYKRVQIGKSVKATEIVIPLIDLEDENAQVRYIFDGNDLWHRVDTKAAKVIRRTAKRQVVGRG